MGLFDDDFDRGLGTVIQTGSPVLGALDWALGSDPDNPAEVSQDTGVISEGFESMGQESTTNASEQTTGVTNALTGTTGLDTTSATSVGDQTQSSINSLGEFGGATGLGTVSYDPTTGQFTTGLADPYQQNVDSALGASNQAYGALNDFNLDTTMGQRYNALEALQEADRLQSQYDLEDRLYSQGRLGSSGGALEQNALMDAIGLQQATNAQMAYDQALAQQSLLGDQATQFGTAALAPEQMSTELLSVLGALAPQLFEDQISTTDTTDSTTSSQTTGFEDIFSNQVTNSSISEILEQIKYAQEQAAEGIRPVDPTAPMPSLQPV